MKALKKEVTAQKEKYDSESRTNNDTVEALKRETKTKTDSIAKRFQELATLTRLLESKDVQQAQLRARLCNLYKNKGATMLSRKETKHHIRLIESSGLFDAKWYLGQYADLNSDAKVAQNPLHHYVLFGGFEGRNPSEYFNTIWYLEQNPDVAQEGVNPLVHYILHGKSEGRSPTRSSNQA